MRKLGASGATLLAILVFDHPTARQLAAALLPSVPVASSAAAPAAGHAETSINRASSNASLAVTSVTRGYASTPPTRLSLPVLLVLSTPRAGSSLLQLCLNAHPQLYAGQELHLLMFDTMAERAAALGGTDLEEGLFATVMELRSCSLAETEAFLDGLGAACPT